MRMKNAPNGIFHRKWRWFVFFLKARASACKKNYKTSDRRNAYQALQDGNNKILRRGEGSVHKRT